MLQHVVMQPSKTDRIEVVPAVDLGRQVARNAKRLEGTALARHVDTPAKLVRRPQESWLAAKPFSLLLGSARRHVSACEWYL